MLRTNSRPSFPFSAVVPVAHYVPLHTQYFWAGPVNANPVDVNYMILRAVQLIPMVRVFVVQKFSHGDAARRA